MGMAQHEEVGRWGDLLAGDDFGLAKKMGNEVEGVDVKIEQGITFWIIACEVMEVVTDKMLFAQTFLKDLHGRGIAFLQADHSDKRTVKSLLINEGIKFL